MALCEKLAHLSEDHSIIPDLCLSPWGMIANGQSILDSHHLWLLKDACQRGSPQRQDAEGT